MTVRGFTFRLFSPETLTAAQAALLGYLAEGALQPTVSKVFPMPQAPEALRYLIEGKTFGRVLMRAAG